MNTMQRCVIVVGVLAIIVTGIYPPWIGTIGMIGDPKTTVRRSAGYHSIFTAPGSDDKTTFNATFGDIENYDVYGRPRKFRDTLQYEIDRSRLLLEWLMVVLVTAGLALASRYTSPKPAESPALEGALSRPAFNIRSALPHLRSPRMYILLLSTIACFALTYYLVIALPRHNRELIDLERERIASAELRERAEQERQRDERQRRENEDRETKRIQDQAKQDALAERQRQREACDSEADEAYTAYVRLYGTWVEEENAYRASQAVRDAAERQKRATLAYCYKRYGLR